MDTQARKARSEHMITMEEAFQTCEELPLPERLRKLAKWAAQHLSPAEQEWLYQQWQQVLERSMAEPPDESALSVERGQTHTRGSYEDILDHGRDHATGLPENRSRE
jgi:hypothetical protein